VPSKSLELSVQFTLKHVAQIKESWSKINAKYINDMIRVKLKGAFFEPHSQLTVTQDSPFEL
jgi:hypothetical protein